MGLPADDKRNVRPRAKKDRSSGANAEHSTGELRWPATAAVLVAIVLQLRLPDELAFGPNYVVPALAFVLLIPLVVVNPHRFLPTTRNLRSISIALIVAMNVGNITSVALLLHRLLSGTALDGRTLILSAVEIWLTSVIIFGLWLWELDRGGPLARAKGATDDPDLLFAQMTDPSLSSRPWTPTFVDYLYVSLTNSTAFSPTDTLPLRTRTKLLMGVQSLTSLATIAVLGARAVNILK